MALTKKEIAQRKRLGVMRSEVAHIIYYEMKKRGHNGISLANKLGCTPENVYKAVRGNGHSPLVLNALRALGVPEEYLFDPRVLGVIRK